MALVRVAPASLTSSAKISVRRAQKMDPIPASKPMMKSMMRSSEHTRLAVPVRNSNVKPRRTSDTVMTSKPERRSGRLPSLSTKKMAINVHKKFHPPIAVFSSSAMRTSDDSGRERGRDRETWGRRRDQTRIRVEREREYVCEETGRKRGEREGREKRVLWRWDVLWSGRR